MAQSAKSWVMAVLIASSADCAADVVEMFERVVAFVYLCRSGQIDPAHHQRGRVVRIQLNRKRVAAKKTDTVEVLRRRRVDIGGELLEFQVVQGSVAVSLGLVLRHDREFAHAREGRADGPQIPVLRLGEGEGVGDIGAGGVGALNFGAQPR